VGASDIERTLRVLKMRGSSHVTHPYRLQIAQGGLQVEPPPVVRADRRQVGAALASERPLEGLRILLVEDFADAREIVTNVLRHAGAEVTASASSPEALATLEQGAPDVIVADIGLPGEDGLQFMRKVRARPGEEGRVPAVALTAWGLPRDRELAKEAGYQAHLVKPIEPATLVSVLGAMVGKAS
jgi:CheY-like chemotaxis protein